MEERASSPGGAAGQPRQDNMYAPEPVHKRPSTLLYFGLEGGLGVKKCGLYAGIYDEMTVVIHKN